MKRMKIKDFIKMEIDIDVYDNVEESLAIAFCGPAELTAEGKRKFAEALEYDIDVDERYGAAVVDVDCPDWTNKLTEAKAFFYAAAGYCREDLYDKWFKEV